MEITGEQLIAANKIYNYLNSITDLDLTLKNNWTDISSLSKYSLIHLTGVL